MADFPDHLSNPPAHGSPITSNGVDASEYARNGTVRFSFTNNGASIGYRLKIQITKGCKDEAPFFAFWKTCRPYVRVRVIDQFSHYFDPIPVVGIHKVLSFDAKVETEPTDDDSCIDGYLIITVQTGTEILPGFNLDADLASFLAKARASGQVSPVMKWTLPFHLCCEDCKPRLTFANAAEEG